jgi:CSLREA domain-containing protein
MYRHIKRRYCPTRSLGRRSFLRLLVEPLEDRSLLATVMVTSLADDLAADGGVTLREAIQAANSNLSVDGSVAGQSAPVIDTIVFQAGLTGPINLALGQFQITETLTIQGLGASQTTVNGQNASRLFDVTNTASAVTFDGLTLTGGKTTAIEESGGAVRSASTGELIVRNCTIFGNSTMGSGSRGGGIFAADPAVTITNSTVSGNFTSGLNAGGGGIFAHAVALTNSTVSGNSTMGSLSSGGGVASEFGVRITNSTISGNSTEGQTADGGGIFLSDAQLLGAFINNSTITGNSVAGTDARGGGIYAYNSPIGGEPPGRDT